MRYIITTSFQKKTKHYYKSHIVKISQIRYFILCVVFAHTKKKEKLKIFKNLNNPPKKKQAKSPLHFPGRSVRSVAPVVPSPVQQSPLPLRRGLAPPQGELDNESKPWWIGWLFYFRMKDEGKV